MTVLPQNRRIVAIDFQIADNANHLFHLLTDAETEVESIGNTLVDLFPAVPAFSAVSEAEQDRRNFTASLRTAYLTGALN